MKAADLREKSVEDLNELQKTLARDVFQNRLKNFTNRLDDTSMMRKTKRDLARVVTLLREQAMGIVRAPAAAKAEASAPASAEAKPPRSKSNAALTSTTADHDGSDMRSVTGPLCLMTPSRVSQLRLSPSKSG